MSGCCGLSRRELLQWGALVAASPFLGALVDPERAYASAAGAGVVPMNLELVTVTETSAIMTWYTGAAGPFDEFGRLAPAPSDGEILMGTSPATMKQVWSSARPTPYHYAEITGLEPGQTYFYLARSGGVPAAPAPFFAGNPAGTAVASGLRGPAFAFTTPPAPKGAFLFSVVLCNDLHLGETTAGLITTQQGMQLPPGFTQRPGQPPYPEVMGHAMVADGRARQASYLLGAGDITSEAQPADLAAAKAVLDGFGRQGKDWFVARGNHDRSHSGPAYNTCRVDPRGPGLHDCFADEFTPAGPTWHSSQTPNGLRVMALDTYDKVGNGGDNGVLSDAQFAFVTEQLAAEPDRPTIVFGHHPVSQESSVTTAEPVLFDLDTAQSIKLQQLYAKAPGVFLHHAGHTHRNKRTASPVTPNVVYQEVGATKEYPGGFHLLRVHTGGYALNFYKTRSDLAREWSERTRQETFAVSQSYVFGSAADRNSVFSADFSGLTPQSSVPRHPNGAGGHPGAAPRPTTGSASAAQPGLTGTAAAAGPGAPGGQLAATGGLPGAALGVTALAAAAAGVVARQYLSADESVARPGPH